LPEEATMSGKLLQGEAFRSRDTPALARDLLGKFLVRAFPDGSSRALMITEVEAYDGRDDLACHASKGRTPRTEVMFQPGGLWYVYFIYGMYEMLNLVTGPPEYPAAILLRGVEGISGPGRLTRALGIDRSLNRRPVAPETGLFLEDRGIAVPEARVARTPRIGIGYAGPIWSEAPYRFVLSPAPVEGQVSAAEKGGALPAGRAVRAGRGLPRGRAAQ
jgi:DNA-3-methyladenine glycosylase